MAAPERWATPVASSLEPESPLRKVWTYLKNELKPLKTFAADGHASIDNNAAERGLRRIAIGKKLLLFFRGDVPVERAAVLRSVLMTARC